VQGAELGERLKQSIWWTKELYFAPQLLIKNTRLGEAVFLCINQIFCEFRFVLWSIEFCVLWIFGYVWWEWELVWLLLVQNPFMLCMMGDEGFDIEGLLIIKYRVLVVPMDVNHVFCWLLVDIECMVLIRLRCGMTLVDFTHEQGRTSTILAQARVAETRSWF